MNDTPPKTFQTTLDKLKTRGYWRIDFYPSEYSEDVMTSTSAIKELVRESSIHLRGWDIPHIVISDDEKQATYRIGDRYESWIDWHIFKEIWRFYKSGKFTFLKGLTENWYDEFERFGSNPLPDLEPNTVLDVIDTIWTLTEIMAFTSNIAQKVNNVDEWTLKITLNNMSQKRLALLDNTRIPLSMDYTNHTDSIKAFEGRIASSELSNSSVSLDVAKRASKEIFDHFEWSVSDTLLDGEQDKLINKRFF